MTTKKTAAKKEPDKPKAAGVRDWNDQFADGYVDGQPAGVAEARKRRDG